MNEDFNKLIDTANENNSFNMPQFNPNDYPSLECDKCGCVAFMPGVIIKKIPGVLVGSTHKIQLMPDQILVCTNCGTILKKDREYYKINDDGTEDKTKFKSEPEEEKKSNIII